MNFVEDFFFLPFHEKKTLCVDSRWMKSERLIAARNWRVLQLSDMICNVKIKL